MKLFQMVLYRVHANDLVPEQRLSCCQTNNDHVLTEATDGG